MRWFFDLTEDAWYAGGNEPHGTNGHEGLYDAPPDAANANDAPRQEDLCRRSFGRKLNTCLESDSFDRVHWLSMTPLTSISGDPQHCLLLQTDAFPEPSYGVSQQQPPGASRRFVPPSGRHADAAHAAARCAPQPRRPQPAFGSDARRTDRPGGGWRTEDVCGALGTVPSRESSS